MHHCMPPSKTGWPSLNVVIFPSVMRLVLEDPKQLPLRRLLIKFTSQFLETAGFRLNQLLSNGNLTWAGWVHYSWRFGNSEALREVCPEMSERVSKTSTVPVVWAIFSARSNWFPVAIGDHWRNLVISLWTGDKATINGIVAYRLTPPPKIPSAKIHSKSSRLEFLGSRRHPPHWLSSKGPNHQRAVLLISSGAIEWYFEGNNAAWRSPIVARQCPGSPGTCNPEETGLPGLPVSWLPTLFSGGGHCCGGDLVGRTTFWSFFFLSSLRS